MRVLTSSTCSQMPTDSIIQKNKKNSFLILFISFILCKTISAQRDSSDFYDSCDKELVFDTIMVNRVVIRYKVVSRHTDCSQKTKSVYGDIIIPDKNNTLDKLLLQSVMSEVGSLTKIDTFYAFQTCAARFIYSSSFAPGSRERMAVESQIIGVFNLKETK